VFDEKTNKEVFPCCSRMSYNEQNDKTGRATELPMPKQKLHVTSMRYPGE
jgi:hypothetical protein